LNAPGAGGRVAQMRVVLTRLDHSLQ
jgi:hypothetical protein